MIYQVTRGNAHALPQQLAAKARLRFRGPEPTLQLLQAAQFTRIDSKRVCRKAVTQVHSKAKYIAAVHSVSHVNVDGTHTPGSDRPHGQIGTPVVRPDAPTSETHATHNTHATPRYKHKNTHK